MSFISSMVFVAGGAALGAGVSAATGGDPAKGAMIGGISGLASGALGALGPAFEGGDVAAQVGEKAAEQTAQQGVEQVAQQGAQQLAQEGANQTIQQGAQQAAQQGTQQLAQEGTQQAVQQSANQGITALDPAKFEAMNAGANPAANLTSTGNTLNPAATQTPGVHQIMPKEGVPYAQIKAPVSESVGQPVTQADLQAQQASTASWGQKAANALGADYGTATNKIGGQALENAVYGAGINGLMAGAQGQDVGKAMGIGALSGGVGGAAAGGLGQMGGAVGEFATAHPMITSGAIGMGTNMALNGLTMPSSTTPEGPTLKSPFRYNPASYRAYLPHGNSFGSYAAGGITDLDNYDAAPNQPTAADPGTLNIPNRGEVANNEGYTTDAVRMMAHGGISDLGSYSDGGRLLKGPGDGVSDDIPASIEGKQPARLASNEFVIPSRIVSEIGNGSTDAGARALYAMMDRVQNDRKKSIGKGKFAVDSKAYKQLDRL